MVCGQTKFAFLAAGGGIRPPPDYRPAGIWRRPNAARRPRTFAASHQLGRLKCLLNMVNSVRIIRGRTIPMVDYSVDYSGSVPPIRNTVSIRSTVYGVDSAIVIVVFAALLFWTAVGTAVWFLL